MTIYNSAVSLCGNVIPILYPSLPFECACLGLFVWLDVYLRNHTSKHHQIFYVCFPYPWLHPPLAEL